MTEHGTHGLPPSTEGGDGSEKTNEHRKVKENAGVVPAFCLRSNTVAERDYESTWE
jgi:hypothetical protein